MTSLTARRYALALGLALLLGAFSPAQRPIFVVDASGGAGSHFADLPAAVAAVPDGSVLVVRPGTYSPFTLASKGLAIVADEPGQAYVREGSIDIAATSRSQPVLLKGLRLGVLGASVTIRKALGAVLLEDVRYALPPSGFLPTSTLSIAESPNVQFHRCDFSNHGRVSGSSSFGFGDPRVSVVDSGLQLGLSQIVGEFGFDEGGNGNPALQLVRSRCVAVGSSLAGGRAGVSNTCINMGRGGDGVWVDDRSTFISLRSPVVGGSSPGSRSCPGAGGSGIAVRSSSFAVFEGAAPNGGLGYPLGLSSRTSSNGVLQVNAAAAPSVADLVGAQAVGHAVRFALEAEPGSLAALLFAADPGITALEPFTFGSLLSAPARSIGPWLVSDSGRVEVPARIPAAYPLGETYHWQFVTLEPSNTVLWATNSFALHVSRSR